MSGFQNPALNKVYKEELFNRIVDAIVKGCELMVRDCTKGRRRLYNHEEKIRTYLTEHYLDNDEERGNIGLQGVNIRFEIEVPENYNPTAGTYIGRTDIKIVSDDWFRNRDAYYIVECKRLDSGSVLNNKYVKDGVSRFVGAVPKYSSFYNRNIMLGFCVKKHDITRNIIKIAYIHTNYISEESKGLTKCCDTESYKIYESAYTNPTDLELKHIIYDVADIIV